MWCMNGAWGAYMSEKNALEQRQQPSHSREPSLEAGEHKLGNVPQDLDAVLVLHGLKHLRPLLQGQSIEELSHLDRPAILALLKSLGLALSDRQKLATAVAKTLRAASHVASSKLDEPSRIAVVDPQPQSFTIFCHRTTLEDGTSLDNSNPAPDFIIAQLERSTGIRRPDEAATMSLEMLNLYFTSGGGGARPTPAPS